MRTEVIEADTVDAAAERILDELKADTFGRNSSRRGNVIYFDGWDGLGASVVLRAVADAAAAGRQQFDQIIHVDCSKWESRRAMQRLIAEQLELPAEVMDMFGREDEEDDFHGVPRGSRAEIPQVQRAMHRRIQELNRRFLVIFHNGSSEEVDLSGFGFPLSQYLDNKVLWTFQGRFRLYPREKVEGAIIMNKSSTDVFFSSRASHDDQDQDQHSLWSLLVSQEAAQVVAAAAAESKMAIDSNTSSCFLAHMLKLCCIGHNLMMDYDLGTHACNYWVCGGEDGIIMQQQGEGDGDQQLWRACDALQREMRLDVDYYCHYDREYFPSHLARYGKSSMVPPAAAQLMHGSLLMPAGTIPNADMFQDSSKLSVLRLSRRTFSFSSPPFIRCHNLRFLWLDSCQDKEQETKDNAAGAGPVEDNNNLRRCFGRLWVLSVRYTRCDRILSARMLDLMAQLRELNVTGARDWDMGQLQGRLPNIHKLRVTESNVRCSQDGGLSLGMNKMELLNLSGDHIKSAMGRSLNCSSCSSLETVIIAGDGCVGLQKICLRGCAKLENLVLGGSFEELHSLDISGTAVKTLDLSAITSAPKLDELLLLGCDKLCAILWPEPGKRKKYLRKVRMDTTQSGAASITAVEEKAANEGTPAPAAAGSSKSSVVLPEDGAAPVRKLLPQDFDWFVFVKDTRLLWSLVPMKMYFSTGQQSVQMDISSPGILGYAWVSKNGGGIEDSTGSEQPTKDTTTNSSLVHADVSVALKDQCLVLEESQGGHGHDAAPAPTSSITLAFPCPPPPDLDSCNCYMHIQDHQAVTTRNGESPQTMTAGITIPDFISDSTWILHVHDALSITSIPADPGRWTSLRWCRVERCPELEYIFTAPPESSSSGDVHPIFWSLGTFWVSQLLKARSIWDPSKRLPIDGIRDGWSSFEELTLLHMDLCPRLIHLVPFSMQMIHNGSGRMLHTLEIVWCGDLRAVFPLLVDAEAESVQQELGQEIMLTIDFPELKHIHLQELPKLESICGRASMYTPRLETIKVRGCWSLKRLPTLGTCSNVVECDCEKEWWDRLEWDGLQSSYIISSDLYINHQPYSLHTHKASQYIPRHSAYYKKPTLLRGSVLI